VGPEVDIAHSQNKFRHNPHDQNLSEIMRNDSLECMEGVIGGINIALVVGFVAWLTIKVIDHWTEISSWISR
jgi:hypothetical protein